MSVEITITESDNGVILDLTENDNTVSLSVLENNNTVELVINEARDAYQIAVANGFVGSVSEWLVSIGAQVINGDTETTLTGILKGNGSIIEVATPNVDYLGFVLTNIADGQILTYDAASSKFINETPVDGLDLANHYGTLDSSDVIIDAGLI